MIVDGDPRQAAARLWSNAPCGAAADSGPDYLERQIIDAERYAPWLADVVGLESARDIDVLDLGCGPGILLARFALRGARVYGVDLVAAHIDQARVNLAVVG